MSEVIQLDHFRSNPSQHLAVRYAKKHPLLAARPERERRKKLWRKAEAVYRFYDALCTLSGPAKIAFNEGGLTEAKAFAHYGDDACRLYLQRGDAARQFMLTPAPTMVDLKAKSQLRWRLRKIIEPEIAAKIDELIASDEAWLLAHAGHRTNRRPT